ncbi:hypothetical protein LINPERHAP1_LOCUS9279, partial [Linum perenne]
KFPPSSRFFSRRYFSCTLSPSFYPTISINFTAASSTSSPDSLIHVFLRRKFHQLFFDFLVRRQQPKEEKDGWWQGKVVMNQIDKVGPNLKVLCSKIKSNNTRSYNNFPIFGIVCQSALIIHLCSRWWGLRVFFLFFRITKI